MYQFISNSQEDTISLALSIAPILKNGDIIILSGELRVW